MALTLSHSYIIYFIADIGTALINYVIKQLKKGANICYKSFEKYDIIIYVLIICTNLAVVKANSSRGSSTSTAYSRYSHSNSRAKVNHVALKKNQPGPFLL